MKSKDYFKQFDIHFGSLGFGTHRLDLEVNDMFFEKHDIEDIIGGKVHVRLELERKETLVVLHFSMEGTLSSVCDRCLDEISIPAAGEETLMLKIVSEPCESDDENIVFIQENVHSYNVEQTVFEYLYAMIPMRKVHGETGNGTCNPEMLELIEKAKAKPTKQEDSRWEALKQIELEDN
ncbi:MAG: DUF177 domain-containing protein [Lentimicrobiaceae bacterium]|nr:DUF177 domain-containing protein [Lentimicrobiaceae bacterium]